MSGSVKRLRHQDIVESHFSTQSLFLIAEDAKLIREQTPENVELLKTAIENENVAEVRRLLIDEKLVSPNTQLYGANTVPFFQKHVIQNAEMLRVFLDCATLNINYQKNDGAGILWFTLPPETFKMIIADSRIDLELRDSDGECAIQWAKPFELSHFVMHPKQPILRTFSRELKTTIRTYRIHAVLSKRLKRWCSIPIQIARVIVFYMFYFVASDSDVIILRKLLQSDGTYSIREILWMGGVVTDLGIKQLKEKRKQLGWHAIQKQIEEFNEKYK
jgi:hypothetical protein